jgi:hypothetical protein
MMTQTNSSYVHHDACGGVHPVEVRSLEAPELGYVAYCHVQARFYFVREAS